MTQQWLLQQPDPAWPRSGCSSGPGEGSPECLVVFFPCTCRFLILFCPSMRSLCCAVLCCGNWVLPLSQAAPSIWEGCSDSLNPCDHSWAQGLHLQTPAAISVGSALELCCTALCLSPRLLLSPEVLGCLVLPPSSCGIQAVGAEKQCFPPCWCWRGEPGLGMQLRFCGGCDWWRWDLFGASGAACCPHLTGHSRASTWAPSQNPSLLPGQRCLLVSLRQQQIWEKSASFLLGKVGIQGSPVAMVATDHPDAASC